MPSSHSLPQSAPMLEGVARRYAAVERAEAETLIDQQVAAAIREWRVADATFWQRVKFRSRMIRAATALRRDPQEGA